ncbi:phosphotransferase [Cellulomonas pakistanensis]|uniref:Trifolitoxin immunity domain-containing protein n=1 Tax=Cellulomonas pakistanensis TaxID=992287 RepID=A0A919PAY1_9CELL|nr:phosphotransferase [Cellulomonas pakistanensis]GIG34922.1 trifolitoxin immunity domain-containing protein [Cellulomonas pakistanensis]
MTADDAPEVPLPGGGMGGAVLSAGTVRRAPGPWTPTIQRLLRHLRAHGVGEVPRPLGTDERGRDVTEYLDGEVPAYPMPAWVWDDRVLLDAAALLRRVHDATASFDRAGAVWRLPVREPAEVICHDDAAPYNMVFRDGRPVGLIDWDTAAPGPRVWDLAYLAYRLVPLGPAGADPGPVDDPERRRRLALLCGAYGGVDASTVLATAVVRLRELARFTAARAGGDAELLRHVDLYLADAAWLEDRADLLTP